MAVKHPYALRTFSGLRPFAPASRTAPGPLSCMGPTNNLCRRANARETTLVPEVMSEIPAEFKVFADLIRVRSAKIEEHQKLLVSDKYREQSTHLQRLIEGAVEALQTSWIMSTRSSTLSDETLTFRFIDDAIFSIVGIGNLISNGAHNPARREMRYLLESVCKHYHVDASPLVSGSPLEDKLVELKVNVPRSSIDFVDGQDFYSLDRAKANELQAELKDMFATSCKYVHRSREQIDEYLAGVKNGTSPGFESVAEFKTMNREFARLCDAVIFLTLAVLGPSGLAGDLFVHSFDQNKSWPYHKTKYCKALSEHYNYKAERRSK